MTKKDKLLKFKYIGYCLAALPPDNITYEDLIKYAKFHLCMQNHILMKDKIWDNYADEELLVEYFASLYYHDDKYKDEFEGLMRGESEDLMDWFSKMEEQNKKELEEQLDKTEDQITLNPTNLDEDKSNE